MKEAIGEAHKVLMENESTIATMLEILQTYVEGKHPQVDAVSA